MQLHEILCGILESNSAYFQPPEGTRMRYPAIVYQLDVIRNEYADDGVYLSKPRYSVTLIIKDPDSDLIMRIAGLPLCSFQRHYIAENLNHYVFQLYF